MINNTEGDSLGVYFLANDSTLDITIAFLNSFRRYNPSLQLCLIPFDDDCEAVLALRWEYQFTVFDRLHILKWCDEISLKFHSAKKGHYRKLACWFGDFKGFCYIDTDTVFLRPVSEAFSKLSEYDVIAGHSHIPGSKRFVWKDGLNPPEITPSRAEYAANTGFLISRTGILSERKVLEGLNEAVALSHRMELSCAEQPFFNVLFTRPGVRYTSFHQIGVETGDADIFVEAWAGDSNWNLKIDGPCSYLSTFKNVLFVHWAGEWHPSLANTAERANHVQNWHDRYRIRRDMRQIDIWIAMRAFKVNSI